MRRVSIHRRIYDRLIILDILRPFMVRAVWPLCITASYFTLKAARDVRKEIVVEWRDYRPSLLVIGDIPSREKPFTLPIIGVASLLCSLYMVVAIVTWVMCGTRELVHVTFKNSELLSPWRQFRITRDISVVRQHFVNDLGIDAPLTILPIQIGAGSGVSSNPRANPFIDRIFLTTGSIDDRSAVTYIYIYYALHYLYWSPLPENPNNPPNAIPLDLLQTTSLNTFATYLNRSYWNRPTVFPVLWGRVAHSRIDDALWDMRGNLNPKAMDEVVAYAARSIHDSPRRGIRNSGAGYTFARLLDGVGVKDNDGKAAALMTKIWTKHGLPTE
jgi:hypothetical protein